MQTYLSGQATAALKTTVDAYVAAHPNDGNGFALQCAIDESNALSHGLDVLAVVPECQKALALAPQSAFANYVTGDALYDGGSIAESIPYYSKAIDLGVQQAAGGRLAAYEWAALEVPACTLRVI